MYPQEEVVRSLERLKEDLAEIARLRGTERGHRASLALLRLTAAPWSVAAHPSEAVVHGWLSEIREGLLRIERNPDGDSVPELLQQIAGAAEALRRELRERLHPFKTSPHAGRSGVTR